MAIIGNLTILMTADVRKAERDIRGVGAAFDSVRRGAANALMDTSAISNTLASIGRYGLVVGGVAAGVGLLSSAVNTLTSSFSSLLTQLDKIGDMKDLSDSTGETVANLQALSLQARTSGSSQEDMIAVVRRLNVTLSEAANGSVEAANAFKQIGLDANTLLEMSPAERFGAISDAIVGLGDAATMAQAANDIFGKRWQSVIGVIISGSAGFKAAREDVERFGLAVSDVDAARIEEAGDGVERIRFAMENLAVRILPDIADLLESILPMIEKAVERTSVVMKLMAVGFGTSRLGVSARAFAATFPDESRKPPEIDKTARRLLEIEAERDAVGKGVKDFKDAAVELANRFKETVNVAAAFRGSADSLTPFLRRTEADTARGQAALLNAQKQANKSLDSIDRKLKPNSLVLAPVRF